MADFASGWQGDPVAVVSVMGPHAGESVEQIFERKIRDIRKIGWTLWLIRSYKARPDIVQRMCSKGHPVCVVFIEPSRPAGARPATSAMSVVGYSADRITWVPMPSALGPVTGKLDGAAHALVMDRLELCREPLRLDVWAYGDYAEPELPLRTMIGCSTVCAARRDMSTHPSRMKHRLRSVIACGRLHEPSAVWLR
jgi:hypothetical protein